MLNKHRILLPFCALTLSNVLPGETAHAQSTPETMPVLEEIIVTAQRRAEDLQKTPIAVTALSADTLEQRNVTSSQELMQVVPSLQVSTQTAGNGSGSATFFLRGLGQQRAGNGSQPAVGIYVDDFYYPSLNGSIFSILDLAQVEVLRGPQGTLFGRNTIGGAIRYTTKKPDHDLGGMLTATYGSFDRVDFTGAMNLPMGDKVSLRMTLGSLDSDGFVRREITGGKAGGSNTQLVRAQLRIEPTTEVTIDLEGQYSKFKLDGFAYRRPGPFPGNTTAANVGNTWNTVPVGPIAVGRAALGLYDNRFLPTCDYCQPGTKSPVSPEEFSNTINKSGNAVVAWNISKTLSFKSLTGFTQVDSTSYTDLDGTPIPVLGLIGANFVKAVSQELQLNGRSFNEALKWIAGLYYYDENLKTNGQTVAVTSFVNGPTRQNPGLRDTRNIAGFIDATWQMTDALSILGGYRYSTESKEVTRVGLGAALTTSTSKDFNSNTGRIGVKYQWTPDIMSYLTVSQGFRSGGFNQLAVVAPTTTATTTAGSFFESFDPETSTTYELGGRMTLLNNRLRLNPTVFYNQWDKIQVQRFETNLSGSGPPQIIHLENAGKAHTYGAELEFDAAITRALHVFGNASTLEAKYDRIAANINSVDKTSTFQRAPKLSYGLGASYTFDIGEGELVTTANYSWQDKQNSTPTDRSGNGSVADTLTLPSYSVTNLRVEYRAAQNLWSVAAFATNIFDKLYFVGGVNYPDSSPHYDLGRPREFGITARLKF